MALSSTEIIISLLSATFGGAGVRLLDKVLSRRGEQFVEAEKIRNELRIEIESLKKEIDQLSQEVIMWRERYWSFYEEAAQLRTELALLKSERGSHE